MRVAGYPPTPTDPTPAGIQVKIPAQAINDFKNALFSFIQHKLQNRDFNSVRKSVRGGVTYIAIDALYTKIKDFSVDFEKSRIFGNGGQIGLEVEDLELEVESMVLVDAYEYGI